MIGPDVDLGNNCKIQNNVSIYKGVTLDDGVFCGPSCVFTNVNNPRADVERKDEFLGTEVAKGVTIGANATIVCGNKLGAFSLIGAGALSQRRKTRHNGGKSSKTVGLISHSGEKLDENLTCPRDGRKYRIDENGNLQEF